MKNCKIDLFGIPYDVKSEAKTQRIKDLKGRIYYDEQIILIDDTFPEATQKATLLHEVMHKILHHVGLEDDFLSNNKVDYENATELIATSLFNVMMSNKGLFYDLFLREELKADKENLTQADLNNIKDLLLNSNKGKCGPG